MKSQRSASKLHPSVDLSKRGPKQLIQIFMHFLQYIAAVLVLQLLKKKRDRILCHPLSNSRCLKFN